MLGLSRLSYWVLPVIGGVFWLATLMALLLYWVFSTNRMHYPSMGEAQTLAYISDVGAYNLKPLFITGSVLTTIFFDLAFAADRWLRHRGRLVPNHTTMEKVLSGLTIFFAVVGTVGLILLSIFDTASHPMLHNLFLGFFIGGYMLSAVFICWEYQRLGVQHREHSILATSFWVKLAFIIVEVALAIVFGVTTRSKNYNVAAAVEWTIAFIFVFYVWSFVIDLYPAVRTRRGPGFGGHSKGMAVPVEAEQEMGERSSGSQSSGMPAAHNHHQQYRSAQQNF